ncbi:hypothetical protein BD311DRAFT_672282 [Dichomitus squalens]|uniref:Uncharacterized protein n=1 Tax=Dichomitus squalens TaxID=114155 RepID=A0A4Q9MEG6_9APHY|nr:hypothetical protein BD311DRAFT_672282 [Dichomitus squalens]
MSPALTSHEPSTPASPFSASFDPNESALSTQASLTTPLAIRQGPFYPSGDVQLRPAGPDVSALLAHRLSASFGAIAEQIAAASRALAVPASNAAGALEAPSGETGSGSPSQSAELAALETRLGIVERAQEQLSADVQQVQAELLRLNGVGSAHGENQQGEGGIVEVRNGAGAEGTGEFKSATEMAIEELQKKVEGIIETIKLDQARLYARLHNSTVTSNKHPIKAPVTANGKVPQNFPNTKGEFEHLTKERYEHILNAYNVTPKGDTKAKREQLREFIGLTPPTN